MRFPHHRKPQSHHQHSWIVFLRSLDFPSGTSSTLSVRERIVCTLSMWGPAHIGHLFSMRSYRQCVDETPNTRNQHLRLLILLRTGWSDIWNTWYGCTKMPIILLSNTPMDKLNRYLKYSVQFTSDGVMTIWLTLSSKREYMSWCHNVLFVRFD